MCTSFSGCRFRNVLEIRRFNISHDLNDAVESSFFWEQFSTRVRYTGAALGHQFGAAITGFTPLIAGALSVVGVAREAGFDLVGLRVVPATLVELESRAMRLLPGDGELPLTAFLAALPAGIPVSVEAPVLSLQKSLRPVEFARRARAAVANVVPENGGNPGR